MGFELIETIGDSLGRKPKPDDAVLLWMRLWQLDEDDKPARVIEDGHYIFFLSHPMMSPEYRDVLLQCHIRDWTVWKIDGSDALAHWILWLGNGRVQDMAANPKLGLRIFIRSFCEPDPELMETPIMAWPADVDIPSKYARKKYERDQDKGKEKTRGKGKDLQMRFSLDNALGTGIQ